MMSIMSDKNTVKETIAQYITLPEKKEKDPLDKENAEIYEKLFQANKATYSEVLEKANHLFLEIREIVREFVNNHSNAMLLDLTDELRLPAMNYTVTVYCYNPYRVATMITNQIYEKIQHPMLTCRTIVEHEEFSIDVTGRSFVKVFSLAPGESSKKSSFAIKSLQNDRIMPAEWEIINLLENSVYGEEDLAVDDQDAYIKKRYDEAIKRYKKHLDKIHDQYVLPNDSRNQYVLPQSALLVSAPLDLRLTPLNSQNHTLNAEKSGSKDIKIYYPNVHESISGGREKSCKESSKSLVDQIKLMLIYDVFQNEDFVLFGTWAHAILRTKGKPCINQDRIQLSYRKGPAELTSLIQKFVNEKIGKYTVVMGKIYPIELPEEYRLKKATIKVMLPSVGEVSLVEWISPLQYSTIPVSLVANEKQAWQIACRELLQRYAFIDMFIMFNVYQTNNISKEKYLQQQRKLLAILEDQELGEPTNMVGYHTPYLEYRKFYMLESKKFTPYQPSQGIKTV